MEKEKVFVIAPKKAVTSKRGVLAEGMICSPKDFKEGEKTFKALVDGGFICEKDAYNTVRDTLKGATKEDVLPPVTGEEKKPAPAPKDDKKK